MVVHMLEIIPLLCIFAAILLLAVLSIIDLKILILPDELNFLLGLSGLIFHFATSRTFMGYDDMAMGVAMGAGMLFVIRFFSNRHYGRDTLGLGDVKLLGAAGIWLGLEGTLMAVTAGAFAGLLHGLAYAGWISVRDKTPYNIHQLSIPAGPGFAVGIIISGYLIYGRYVQEQLHALFS